MKKFILTDCSQGVWVDHQVVHARDFGPKPVIPWSITKRTLRGGRRDGVDLIEVDNGALSYSIIPTRGMGIWKGRYEGRELGWESPVRDGPINPSFVNLMNWGGLGWLEGFDELLVRCGLENNGAPYQEGTTTYGLHGKIANTPAREVAIQIGDGPAPELVVEGRVDESKLFSTQVQLATRITTTPRSNRLIVRDTYHNLSDLPQEMQILYHWNFGPPFLQEGSRFVAPARSIVPRNTRAVEGVGHLDIYQAPEPGFGEQVYFYDLLADPRTGQTLALLRDRDGQNGVALRYDRAKLPAFSLWKNTGGRKSGYVTGLEPGSNYPNPKPFEKARGRIVTLPVGGEYVVETGLEVLTTRESVAAVEEEVRKLQEQARPMIHSRPVEPFAPE
jgi:hypothetical protein